MAMDEFSREVFLQNYRRSRVRIKNQRAYGSISKYERARRDLNPRSPAPKAGALIRTGQRALFMYDSVSRDKSFLRQVRISTRQMPDVELEGIDQVTIVGAFFSFFRELWVHHPSRVVFWR